jgi:hypothetical protein
MIFFFTLASLFFIIIGLEIISDIISKFLSAANVFALYLNKLHKDYNTNLTKTADY